MFVQKNRGKITASEEESMVQIPPEATDLLFEAEDVAELLAEVTEQVVGVSVDGDDIIFNVGDEEYTVTPDGDEEVVESSVRARTGKKSIASSRRVIRKAPVAASRYVNKGRSVRRISR